MIDPAAKTILNAGRFRAVFVDGRLQWLTVGGVEVVRRVYFAFRDERWTTVPYAIDQIDARVGSDGFEVAYTATARSASGDFRFTCEMAGGADDVVQIRLRGEALTRMTKNRLGLCLHYPHELAGHALRYQQVDDPTERQGIFPSRIAPEQPLLGLGSISHAVSHRVSNRVHDALWCRASFHGDVWEMEDQRNFSDASYKVYSTPASDPIPVVWQAGHTVEQRIVLALADSPSDLAGPVGGAAAGERDTARSQIYLGAAALATLVRRGQGPEIPEVDVEVGTESSATVPALGTDITRLCTLQDAFPRSLEAIHAAAAATVHGLRLAHVRLELDTSHTHWRRHLDRGFELTAASDAKLELVVSSAGNTWPGGLSEAIARHVDRVDSVCVAAVAEAGMTLGERVRELRQRVRAAGADVAVGSGTAGWFVELNQSDLPLDELDFLSYSLTPQVHAFDDDILRENLHGQHDQLASAHLMAQGRELRVGPVNLRPRGPEAGATDALWPTPRDPRLDSSFGAVWTLGAIAGHAQGSAATLTLFEAYGAEAIATDAIAADSAGAAGLAIRTVMYEFAGLRGRAVVEAGTGSPLDCVAFAIRDERGSRCYLANLTDAPVRARVRLPGPAADVSAMVMSSTATRAEPQWRTVEVRGAADGKRVVRLEPYSMVRLRWSDRDPNGPGAYT